MISLLRNPHHPVEELFRAMHEVEPFPREVVKFRARLSGIGFFPGGAGLWGVQAGSPLPEMPTEGIMVLGHDFHSEAGFAKSLARGGEVQLSSDDPAYPPGPTWSTLLKVLAEAGIARKRCFFTNVYMGLRTGAGNVGRFPGAADSDFVERCRTFFRRQLHAQRPRMVLTLGVWVPRFLAPLASELSDWSGARSLADIDRLGPVRHHVSFESALSVCSVVALTHPSLRAPNVGRRHFGDERGHSAEMLMIREAVAKSRVNMVARGRRHRVLR